MPWKESRVVNERAKFCLEWHERWDKAKGGRVDLAELCRVFGISRQTGYKWLRRFREAGHDVRGLADRSRRPPTRRNRRGPPPPGRRPRRRPPPLTAPFAQATAANAVWCIDFKGKFKTGDGVWCTAFTVTDACSRYCIRCEAVEAAGHVAGGR